MKITMEVSAEDIYTPDEIIKKLGLKQFCQKRTPGNPLCYSFEDENGEGFFDLASGEVEYAGDTKEDYNFYERELGSYSLAEAMNISTLVWAETEEGEPVAYWE